MIETVITEIVDAEAKAEQILSEANNKAKDISLLLHSQAEEIKQEYANLIKQEVTQIFKAAEVQADEISSAQAKSVEVSVNALLKNSEKNVQRAVEWLADLMVKKNS